MKIGVETVISAVVTIVYVYKYFLVRGDILGSNSPLYYTPSQQRASINLPTALLYHSRTISDRLDNSVFRRTIHDNKQISTVK